MTFVRQTAFQADSNKLDDGIAYFRDTAVPQARQQQGFEGARMLVDRQWGKVVVVTLWASEAAAQASADAMSQSRAQAATVFGSGTPTVEVMEMVVNEQS